MTSIVAIAPAFMDRVLPRVREMIEEGINPLEGMFTLEGVERRFKDGTWILWICLQSTGEGQVPIGVYGTQVIQDDDGELAVFCPLLAGRANMALDVVGEAVVDELDNYAREIGAKRIRGGGRPGWVSYLGKLRPIKTRYVAITWDVE